jgi:hypothetical protein
MTDVGRGAILRLLTDRTPEVRLIAATDALAFKSEGAIGILEELQAGRGSVAIDAEWTLRLFREGTLDLNW